MQKENTNSLGRGIEKSKDILDNLKDLKDEFVNFNSRMLNILVEKNDSVYKNNNVNLIILLSS